MDPSRKKSEGKTVDPLADGETVVTGVDSDSERAAPLTQMDGDTIASSFADGATVALEPESGDRESGNSESAAIEDGSTVKLAPADETIALAAPKSRGVQPQQEGSTVKLDPEGVDLGEQTPPLTEPVAGAQGGVPKTIGPYRLLSRLGEGGMGEVWLAEQETPRRKVAVKLIKGGFATGEFLARFNAERQALALMNHSSIARVFDAGETALGQPYFVMEHVDGEPITEYCDRHRLSNQERLELFIRVCEAVQHAHQKGVIHRDLKPNNVLIAEEDGEALPKIIDFGIAKATDQQLTEETIFTEHGQMMGTPEYMSPEQTSISDGGIDTRTDVYSLGVMLYELIAGKLPFSSKELRKGGYLELQQQIQNIEPPKPSTRVSKLGDDTTELALVRRAEPRSFAKDLRGELDWITMKALEKEPDRRYPFPSELAADIRRFLRSEPVLAGPPSGLYRAKKFVKRHRGMIVAAAIVAVGLLASSVVSTWQAVRATRAEQRAAQEAKTAEEVSEFLASLFDAARPGEVRETELTARELLDDGASRLRGDLATQPLVRAKLMTIVGDVYSRMGLYDQARPLLEDAVREYDTLTDAKATEVAFSLDALAAVHHDQGRLEEGLALSARALEMLTETPETTEDRAGLLLTHGNLLVSLGRDEESLAAFKESIELAQSIDPEHPIISPGLNNVANAYFGLGDFDNAADYYRQSIAFEEKLSSQESYHLATPMHNLSLVLAERGELEQAIAMEERALRIREKVLGSGHWHTALSLSHLGNLRVAEGKLEEAEDLVRRALAIDREQYEPIKSETAWDLGILAEILIEQQRFEEAEVALSEALMIFDTLGFVEDSLFVRSTQALLDERRGRLDDAATGYREVLAGAEDDEALAFAGRAGLARLAAERGNREQALEEIEAALALRPDREDDPDIKELLDLRQSLR